MQIKDTYRNCEESVTRLLQKEMERWKVPGITVAIMEQGNIVYEKALGVKNPAGDPVTEDTLFEAASLTKTLFGTMVMGMAQRGQLNLDQPIMDVYQAKPWSDDPLFASITPRHCLCHGSGLPNWEEQPLKFLFQPMASYSYSGEGYYLLQHMVEQLTGKGLDDLLKETFLKPLGMNRSAAFWTPAIGAAFSNGYDGEGASIKVRDRVDLEGVAPEPNAAWSLYSNAFEMIHFLKYVAEQRGGLSEEQFAEMHRPQNWATPEIPWGLGWGLTKKDPAILWHWGDNTGFKSLSLLDWKEKNALSIFTNSDNGFAFWEAVAKELTDAPVSDIAAFVKVAEA